MTALDPQAMPDRSFDPWNFRPDVAVELNTTQLIGHKVEAIDGTVGKVVEANLAPNDSYLVVATGRWIFGRNILLPAGTVNHIDQAERKVYVDRNKDQITSAPEITPEGYDDPVHRDKLAGHYDGTYRHVT
jgi:hypothetical protein